MLTAPGGEVELAGHTATGTYDVLPEELTATGRIGEYPWMTKLALFMASCVALVRLLGTTTVTIRPSPASPDWSKLRSSSRRRLTRGGVVPVTGRLAPIRALVAQYTGMDVMLLTDATAAAVPLTYSDGRLSAGLHICELAGTKKTSVSELTELTLNTNRPPAPWLTFTHTYGTQVVDPSHDMQYVPLHTCRVSTCMADDGRALCTTATLIGILISSTTRLSADGRGCWTNISCALTSGWGVSVMTTVMTPPPGQITEGGHCTHGLVPRSWPWLMYPGEHAHSFWDLAAPSDVLCSGHRFSTPWAHQKPGRQALQVGPV
jgi:hypothetical protein